MTILVYRHTPGHGYQWWRRDPDGTEELLGFWNRKALIYRHDETYEWFERSGDIIRQHIRLKENPMTTETQPRNFMGIPITGEPPKFTHSIKEQLPGSDLKPLFEAVWTANTANPCPTCGTFPRKAAIQSLVWDQYTPYFNDGDPCVFGVGEIRFHPISEADPDADEDGYGQEVASWNAVYAQLPATLRVALTQLAEAVGSGHYEKALYEAFGDHCQVTAYPDRFAVAFYEHD